MWAIPIVQLPASTATLVQCQPAIFMRGLERERAMGRFNPGATHASMHLLHNILLVA